jgi:hypothetical protein
MTIEAFGGWDTCWTNGSVIEARLVDVFEMCEAKAEDGPAPGM